MTRPNTPSENLALWLLCLAACGVVGWYGTGIFADALARVAF